MEVYSDGSSKSPSQVSEEIAANQESSNNNSLNSTKSAQRRTRRSRSNADELVNGVGKKLDTRKSRPFSVDENLISSSVHSNKTSELDLKQETPQESNEKVADTLKGNGAISPEPTSVKSEEVSEISKCNEIELKDGSCEKDETSTKTPETLKPDVRENPRNILDEIAEPMDVEGEKQTTAKETKSEDEIEKAPRPKKSTAADEESANSNQNMAETANEVINEQPEPSKVVENIDSSCEIIEELVNPSETSETPAEQIENEETAKPSENIDETNKSSEITEKLVESEGITKEPIKSSKIIEEPKALELNESLVTSEETVNAHTNQDMEPKTELETKRDCKTEVVENPRPFQTEDNLEKTDDAVTSSNEESTSKVQAGSHEELKNEESLIETANKKFEAEETLTGSVKEEEEDTPKEQKEEKVLDISEECIKEEDTPNELKEENSEGCIKKDHKEVEISPEISLENEEVIANETKDSKTLDLGKVSSENQLKNDKMCNGKSEEQHDEEKTTHILSDDDYELTYSESSNDKIISNPESSIKLKVTDCTNPETLSENLNESKTKDDLVNGINQSSTMEVA